MPKIHRFSKILFLALFCALFVKTPVFASQRLQISPTSAHIELSPTEPYSGSLRVSNIGDETIEYEVSVSPFTVSDRDYVPNFDTLDLTINAITKWISLSNATGTLTPGASTYVYYTVTTPADAPSVGQYAALLARITSKDNSGATVVANSRVAMPIYAAVAGNNREEGTILKNSIQNIIFSAPLSASSVVKNTGNIHSDASYALEVFNFFSEDLAYSNVANPDTHTILPNTTRLVSVSWPDSPKLGLFTVRQTIKFIDQTSINEKLVFLCPTWLLFIFIFALVVLILRIVVAIKKRKSNKKHFRF